MGLYKIKDILYQNNGKGPYLTSKIGKIYDYRRGHIVRINKEELTIGKYYFLKFIGDSGYIITTPVDSFVELEDKTLLNTANSVYVLELLKKESGDEVEFDNRKIIYEITDIVNKDPEAENNNIGKHKIGKLVFIANIEEGENGELIYLDTDLKLTTEILWTSPIINIEKTDSELKFETQNTVYTLNERKGE